MARAAARANRVASPVRRDLAWRHATESDLERITFTIDLSRWRTPDDLSNRAVRVLRFFAALHRCGRVGYVGTRASYAAIGAAMHRAQHEAASRSTVFRSVSELVDGGWLEKGKGRGDRVRQIGPHEYVREQLAVLTLSPAARALWSDRAPAHVSPPVSVCHGYNLPRQAPPPTRGGEPSPERSDEIASPDASAVPTVSEAEPATAGGVEHRDGGAVALAVPRSARPVAPLATLADGDRSEAEPAQAPCQRERFAAPSLPHARRVVAAAILATLADVTRMLGREGEALVSRAEAEIAGRSDAPSSQVEWGYWIARWPGLPRDSRKWWARREIVPLLRSSLPSRSPSSSPRFSPRSPCHVSAAISRGPSLASAPSSAAPRPVPAVAAPPAPLPAWLAERVAAIPEPANPYAAAYDRQIARLASLAEKNEQPRGPER